MDVCSACGAKLSSDLSWCGRCYTPVLRALAPPPIPGRDPLQGSTSSRQPLPQPAQEFLYSRWHGTDTTLGPTAKLGITIGLIAISVAAFPVVADWSRSAGPGAMAFVMVYAGVCLLISLLILGQVWRRGRLR